jgi:thioredoxin reductase/NAD-dependent dihydropyrimidine dehydrogenase PreA subunit
VSGLGLGFIGFLGVRTIRGIRRRPKRRKEVELAKDSLLPTALKKLPQINTATCIGCSACVDACPYDVLEVRSYVAFLARPDDCCGLTLCEQRCPNGSLVITEGDPVEDRPRMDDTLQSLDSPGIYLAGDLTGLPLIRNAINQGSWVVKNVAKSLPKRGKDQFDVVIIGAGPAGLSASLEAKAQGLSYLTLEQGGVAESIRSFPRGKLVFDQPLGVPLVGDLWLSESSKEELLSQWMRILQMHNLEIREGMRVTAVHRLAGGPPLGSFRVDAADRTGQNYSVTTSRIVLACGRRGTPRKLPFDVPLDAQDHVHYSLADARSFAGARVMVVGLGDVAMEAAIGLAGQAGTQVYLSYRGNDFKRGKRRNMEEVKRLVDAGRIELLFETDVTNVQRGMVRLEGKGVRGVRDIPIDALFVMVGNIAPWDFLQACGVNRVKVASSTAVS